MVQVNIASVLGFASLVLITLLITKIALQRSQDPVAKGLLLVLLVGFAAMLMNQLYAVAGLYRVFPHYSYSTVALMFSIGPLVYCNIQRVSSGRAPWELPYWPVHWLLPVILLMAFLPYYWQAADAKTAFIQSSKARWFTGSLYLTNYGQIAVYLFLCLTPLRNFKRNLLNHFSDIQRFKLVWLQLICWGLVSLIVLDITLSLLGIVPTAIYSAFLIANALFLAAVAYTGLGNSALQFPLRFGSELTLLEQEQEQKQETVKYSRSSLREDSAQYLVNKLNKVMAEDQWYLQDDLSLSGLARQLKTQPHHLSQILNEQFNKTFYDYINELRISYAQDRLLIDRHLSVIDIAFASGFNNKVTFYNAFKRFVGVTPSQYRRKNLEPNS